MKAVSEQIIAGDARTPRRPEPDARPSRCHPVCRGSAVDDHRDAHRRELADLPGVLRPARPTWPRPAGQVTNAVFGFTSMLINLVRDHKPDRHRRGLRPARADVPPRAGRRPTRPTATTAPDILRQQMGLVRQVVEALRLPDPRERRASRPTTSSPRSPPRPATAATTCSSSPATATAYQLVEDPHVKVLYNKRGVSDYALYDEAGIDERTGVTPEPVRRSTPRCGAIRPTTCPACPGVGEKTAAKLINKYGGLDGIFAHVDEQTPKLRQNLAEHEAQVRAERRGDGAACATSPSTSTRRRCAPASSTSTRCASCSTSSSSARCTTGSTEALGEEPSAMARPPSAERARGRGRPSRRRRADAVAAARVAGAPATEPLAVAAAWAGAEGRSPLEGLALVADAAAGDVAWIPAELLADADGRRRARARWSAPAVARSPPTRPRRSMRALLDYGVDVRTLGARHRCSPPTCSTRPSPATCSTSCSSATPSARCPTATARAEGQLDFGGDVGAAVARGRPRGRSAVDRLVEPLLGRARRPGPARRSTTTSRCRWSGCWPAWRTSASASTSSELQRAQRPARRRVRPRSRERDLGGRRARSSTSTPPRSCARSSSTSSGSRRRRRPRPASPPTPRRSRSWSGEHPIIEHLLRYREVEKLRSTYGEGLLAEVAARRAHPRHLQPDRGPHRPAQLRRAEPAQHPGAQRGGPGVPQGVRRRPRATSSWSPTTTRSSCAASPTSPRTRA